MFAPGFEVTIDATARYVSIGLGIKTPGLKTDIMVPLD
jgi:hypothetical protein